jgi:hypothetical protein
MFTVYFEILKKRMRCTVHVARMIREVYSGFWWGKYGRKRTLGRSRHRWEDNIMTDLQEVGREHRLDWSGSG